MLSRAVEAGGLSNHFAWASVYNADNAIGDSGEWYGWHYSTAVKDTLAMSVRKSQTDALSDRRYTFKRLATTG